MKKILFLLIFNTIYLFAFNPSPIVTSITEIDGDNCLVNRNVPSGLSGYVIQNNTIIAKALPIKNNQIKLLPFIKLQNTALATPILHPAKNDHIIFGLYNKKALIVAPNQIIYDRVIQANPNINFISSDIFATFFKTKPSKEDFELFAQKYNVGLIFFILDKEYIVDSQSFTILEENPNEKADFNQALYTSYTHIQNSITSFTPNDFIEYYKALIGVK